MKIHIVLKRIVFVSILLIISIASYRLNSIRQMSHKAEKVNSTPITNKTVVLDARPW